MAVAALGLVVLPATGDLAIGMRSTVSAPQAGCRLVSVTDGDTIRLWCGGTGTIPARLLGFDTPELFSPSCPSEYAAALRAKWALRWHLLTAGETRFVREGTDRYGRALVRAFVDGTPVARHMIEAGHARPYDGGQRSGWC